GADLPGLLGRWSQTRVLVLGEAMLDEYVRGSARRISPDAPAPVVDVSERIIAPGGAANAAANLGALGGRPTLLSAVGDDGPGDSLRAALAECGVDLEQLVVAATRRTLTKRRVMADGQMMVRLDEGSTELLTREQEQALLDRLSAAWPIHDAILVSDYQYGVISPTIIDALADLQRRCPRVLVIDSKRLPAFREAQPTAVKPNFEQAMRLLGSETSARGQDRVATIVTGSGDILARTGARIAAVTLDRDGAVILERSRPPYRTHTRATARPTTAGAGDTFVAAFTLGLVAGGETELAANAA